ncbi:MAG: DegT/DnrJ/EryC1/StrS aminotransferase family protein [Burkholderiales bacterium]|jgi:dTDP-4-amino-4,6-dideoxygalactose transaminase|nr:DegT/DnrJ/EryC1/StrS aminotransferase family protein [Burkholderiales bacterium]NBQ29921.1 DegT/DnrJ/EryC1/StrS aminotransferase family protein [Burkholderiaceae bacterium]
MSQDTLPFIPFTKPTIDEATIAAVADVLRSGWITSGPKVLEFENALGDYLGGATVRCFANGTATMKIALQVAGIGPGDEVITTPISWVATSNVILAVGAKPIFVDVDPQTRNLDLNQVAKAISKNTKAIMPVYLAGLPLDVDALYALANQHGLRVIEDAAQALGSSWNGTRIGHAGKHDLVSFSFQANKNLTTIEGGCLVFNTERFGEDQVRLAEKLRLQGLVRSGPDGMEVDILGGKDNLTDINAVIGLHQIKQLDQFQKRRIELAKEYFQKITQAGLANKGLGLPVADYEQSNWHMFQVTLPLTRLQRSRGDMMTTLKERGIGTGVHYPIITGFELYRKLGYRPESTPIAAEIGRSILTIPLFPTMSSHDIDRVVEALTQVLN